MRVRSVISASVVGLALCALAPAHAADEAGTEPQIVTQGSLHEALFDVQFDGQNGLAVGMPALLIESADGGTSWSRTQLPEAGGAFLGAAVKGDEALVVGQMGLVARKQDGDWELLERPTEERLLAVALDGNGLAYAAGGFGTLFKSDDMGESWTSVAPDWEPLMHDYVEPHLNDVIVAENGTIYVAAEFGFVMRSEDQGETWTVDRASKEGAPSVFGLYQAPDGTLWGVGQRGLVMHRNSETGEWTTLNVGTDAILLDIAANNQGFLLVTGIRKLLVLDSDGRVVDTIVNNDIKTNWYQGVATPGGDKSDAHIFVGHHARIMTNRD